MQGVRGSTNDTIGHSMVIIEDVINMESYINEGEEETNCTQGERHEGFHDEKNTIPADVCYNAGELEKIERMYAEALRTQESEWEKFRK